VTTLLPAASRTGGIALDRAVVVDRLTSHKVKPFSRFAFVKSNVELRRDKESTIGTDNLHLINPFVV